MLIIGMNFFKDDSVHSSGSTIISAEKSLETRNWVQRSRTSFKNLCARRGGEVGRPTQPPTSVTNEIP